MSIPDITIIEFGHFKLSTFQLFEVLVLLTGSVIVLKILSKFIKKKSKTEQELGRRYNAFLIIRYVVWVVVISLCLEALGVKVTLLIAGSAALLVGLGMGLQHIFNDLVSGILMLMEGTIQVGNILEIDGTVVRVKEIHLRTSKVVTREGVTIITPNHNFVSENVINWSHDQGQTRFSISIGVAYGSDVKLVTELLIEAMTEHPDVSTFEPFKPFVLFTDFGESALLFEALFYSENIFRVKKIQSDIRYTINQKFSDHKVQIPFPQRDLHIKTTQNIQDFPEPLQ